jgi:pumilio homology domain family member 6
MAKSVKRKVEATSNNVDHKVSKKQKTFVSKNAGAKPSKAQKPILKVADEAEDQESDFDGLASDVENLEVKEPSEKRGVNGQEDASSSTFVLLIEQIANILDGKSRESHQKQKELQLLRKASKPNADDVARAKKLWERLRRKSHVQKDERAQLVTEMFSIISGRVKEFVFKHDSVRVVQCAVKYANRTQKQQIANELKGDFRTLAESKYGKFLLAKLIVEGDDETRKIVIPEFYGHIKKMINHPEASWILDDVYRTVASKEQKAIILRELYGPEFAVFKSDGKTKVTAELEQIIKDSPEKKQVFLKYLQERINQLVQKKMTGFTILHDAMLQYFINLPAESEDFSDFLHLVIGDKDEEETDLLKNLAFTESGSELISLVFARSAAKDRRRILKSFNEVFEMLAYDKFGYRVLLTAFALMDDTREISQRIFSELVLLKKTADGPTTAEQVSKVASLAVHSTGHIALLYPFIGSDKKILGNTKEYQFMQRVLEAGKSTSKKDPEIRRKELIAALSEVCIDAIAGSAKDLIPSAFGCLFITQVLIHGTGDKTAALEAIAAAAAPEEEQDYNDKLVLLNSPNAGKMLKALISGGQFDRARDEFVTLEELASFKTLFLDAIKTNLKDWVHGDGGFVVLTLLHADWEDKSQLKLVKKAVKDEEKTLQKAVKAASSKDADAEAKRKGMVADLLLKELAK